jgi:hypothetical protein
MVGPFDTKTWIANASSTVNALELASPATYFPSAQTCTSALVV